MKKHLKLVVNNSMPNDPADADGVIAILTPRRGDAKGTTRIIATLPLMQVKGSSLQALRKKIDVSKLEEKVHTFDMSYDSENVHIQITIEGRNISRAQLKAIRDEFLGCIRKSGILKKPIISSVEGPIHPRHLH